MGGGVYFGGGGLGGGEVRRGYWDFWDKGGRIVAGQWMCVGIFEVGGYRGGFWDSEREVEGVGKEVLGGGVFFMGGEGRGE